MATVLNWEKVTLIRKLHAAGWTTGQICAHLDISYPTVRGVTNNENWKEEHRPPATKSATAT